MDSQATAKTNAKQVWSQLLYSIISDNPPPNMSRASYYARPLPILIIQQQLKRFGIERYNLGAANAQPRDMVPRVPRNKYHQEIRHIQDRLEFLKHSEKLQANKIRYQQSTEHIQNLMRITSNAIVQANERDFDEQWIVEGISEDSIRYIHDLTWTMRKIMASILDDEMVQVNEDKYQQGIEHSQSVMRSRVVHVDEVVVQANEDKYRQGIQHIQFLTRGNGVRVDDEVVQENEDKYQQGIEDIQPVTRTTGFRVDDEFMQENEDLYHQGIEDIQTVTRSIGFRVDDKFVQENEDLYHQGIEDIQSVTRTIGFSADYKVVQANEDLYHQGIEDIQPVTRSNGFNADDKVAQADEDLYHQGIEDIQPVTRSNVGNELVQQNEGKYYQGNEQIQSVTGTTADEEMAQACEAENQNEIKHEQEVLLSLLAFLEYVEDQIWEEHLTLRSEVLEAYELMHQNGVADTIRSQMEGKDPKMQYQEKRLELLLRICDQEICLRIIHTRLEKFVGNVYCKHCEMSQTNEDGNQLWIKHAKEISNLFDDLLELVENVDMHGEEKPAVQAKVLKLIKILHHYGVDTIRNAVENELEDMKQKYDDKVEDPSMHYKKKGLEVMSRVCGNESYERAIKEIVRESENYRVGFAMGFLFAMARV